MDPPQKKAQKPNKFPKPHKAKYGLLICERDAVGGEAKSVVCRFCVIFGREVKAAAKRTWTTRRKYFETFQMDHYVQNLKKQHAQKWSEYTNLWGREDQEAFFKAVDVAFANTIEAHFDGSGRLQFPINKRIVEVIIKDMLFNPDDIESITGVYALSLFKLVKPDPVDNIDEGVFFLSLLLSLLKKSTSPLLKRQSASIFWLILSVLVPPYVWDRGWCRRLRSTVVWMCIEGAMAKLIWIILELPLRICCRSYRTLCTAQKCGRSPSPSTRPLIKVTHIMTSGLVS